MTFDRTRHRRRSLRLREYDYSQEGAYFFTVCAKDRACVFGEMGDTSVHLSSFGEVVQRCWNDLPRHYPHVVLDAFVIMPNHVHGIIAFADREVVGAGLKPAPTRAGSKRHSLPEVMRAFKSFSSRRVNVLRDNPGQSLWQRGYYEHIVRGEESLTSLRKYIDENPIRWALDQENPANRNRRV